MAKTTRPVLFLTLALNYAASGLEARAYHLTNMLILALSGCALFGIVRRTLDAFPAARTWFDGVLARRAAWLALVSALVWVAHPLQTNLTAYVWQRGEALMALFYLLTLYAFVRGVSSERSGPWFALAWLFCALGMASKEVMMSAPLMVLLYDRTFVAGSFREALRKRAAVYIGLACTWAVLGCLIAAYAGAFHENAGVGFHSTIFSPVEYALTMPGVLAHYLRLVIAPVGLCFDPNWQVAKSATDVLLPLLLIGPMLALTLWALVRAPVWGFLGAWFFLILGPTSSVMPMPDPALEYRLHLPLAGLLVLAVIGVSALIARCTCQRMHAASLAVAALVILAFGCLSFTRCHDYASATTIWTDTFAKRPYNLRAFTNLWQALEKEKGFAAATAHYETVLAQDATRLDAHLFLARVALGAGRMDEAEQRFRAALAQDPDYFLAYFYLAQIAERRGQNKEALQLYQHALAIRPLFAKAYAAVAGIYERQARLKDALKEYDEAIRIWPQWGEGHARRGRALLRAGRAADAVASLTRATQLAPGKAAYCGLLGEALLAQGDVVGAREQFKWALRLDPKDAEWYHCLGKVLLQERRIAEAIVRYQQAVKLDPKHAAAQGNLGVALAMAGRLEEAVAHFRTSLRLDPRQGLVHLNFGMALETLGRKTEAVAHFREAVKLMPQHAGARARLARALERD